MIKLQRVGIFVALLALPSLADEPKIGSKVERTGDEIVVCGQMFHTTAPVVLWTDPGGYDAYRVERRFVPFAEAGWAVTKDKLKNPLRYGMRTRSLSPEQIEKVRGGGWDLPLLQDVVDQFVIHFDVCGTSQRCFRVLHDERGLSVHFMLDIDGTIYQTLDLKEAAWHATIANGRSIGIEIANMGAHRKGSPNPLGKWYAKDDAGKLRITIPGDPDRKTIRRSQPAPGPDRPDLIEGNIQGQDLVQYDLTPQQYESLTKLTATLAVVFPKIKLDYPKDESGKLLTRRLPDDQFARYQGVLGHYHVQTNKVDPGPAFQWDRVIDGARKLKSAR